MDYVVVIGLGQLGRIFAGGLLRAGLMVVPVNRGDGLEAAAKEYPAPKMVLVAVAEGDLHSVLAALPSPWRAVLALIQNELLPRDWQRHGLDQPTVMSVWFEKKKGKEAHPILPSPVFGEQAELLLRALAAVDLPGRLLQSSAELRDELVIKNLYILVSNITGLKVGGTVGELWRAHRHLATAVAEDVLALQEWFVGEALDRPRLLRALADAFAADPEHQAMGRTAAARLQRALALAAEAQINLPTLTALAADFGGEKS